MIIAIDMRSLSQGVGGVAEYTRNIVRSLLDTESTHTYILFTNSWKKGTDFGFPKEGPRHMTLEYHIPNKLFHLSQLLFRRPQIDVLIKKRTGMKPDLLFFPNIHFASFSQLTPAVLTLHDLSFLIHPELLSFKSFWWHRFIAPRSFITRMSHIFAVSDCTKQDCVMVCNRDAQSITVTRLDSDPLFYVAGNNPIVPLAERINIVLLGAHEMRKNAPAALEAFALFLKADAAARKYVLVLVGRDTALFHTMRRRVEVIGIQKNVVFRPFCSDGDRMNLYASARLLLYPSIYEGFGLPLLEAARLHVPILSSCRSSIGEVIGDGALLVDPCNIYDIKAALSALLLADTDVNQVRMLDEALVRSAGYSWIKTAAATREVFERFGKKEEVCA